MTTLVKMAGLDIAESVYAAMARIIDHCEDSTYILVEGFSNNKCTGYHFSASPRRCTVINNPVSDEIRLVYGDNHEFQLNTNWANDNVRFVDIHPDGIVQTAEAVIGWLLSGTVPGSFPLCVHNPPDDSVFVWWTNQGDCEGFIGYHEPIRAEGTMPWGGSIPDYIWDEIVSRNGRSGRGRLWISDKHPCLDLSLSSKFKPDDDFHQYISKYCAGIPILAKDVYTMHRNRGFITDTSLNLILEQS